MTGTITITYLRNAYDAEVSGSTFAMRDDIRTLGGRRDADRKLWTVEPDMVELLRVFAAERDVRCVIVDHRQAPTTPKPPPAAAGWARAMFAALPRRLHDPAYKALARVLHPDVGGDLLLSQQLNDARTDVPRTRS